MISRRIAFCLVAVAPAAALDGTGAAAAGSDGAGPALVFRKALADRGDVRLHGRVRQDALCLSLTRRFPEDGRLEKDHWRSCRLPTRTGRIRVRLRIACAPGEFHVMGMLPPATRVLRGRLSGGRRIRIGVHRAPRRLGLRARLFAAVIRRGELERLRAFDSRGRVLDERSVPIHHGRWSCRPPPAPTARGGS